MLCTIPAGVAVGLAFDARAGALAALAIGIVYAHHSSLVLDAANVEGVSELARREAVVEHCLADLGGRQRAQKRMRDADKPEHRHQVAAHVAAALGEDDEARAALERVSKLQYGPAMVEMIANGHGPARTVALRLVGREPPADADADVSL